MSAFVGYLALGTIDPVTLAFTETTYGGYARQPVGFDLDVPSNGGAVGTGGDVLRNNATSAFPAPAALDWPPLNALAVFANLAGGAAQIALPLGARAGVHQRGTTRSFRAGHLVLGVAGGVVTSPLGGRVISSAVPSIVGGALQFGATSAGGGTVAIPAPTNSVLPAISGSPAIGQVLTASQGTWANAPSSYAYQWARGGVAIQGATAATYKTVAADVGLTVTVTVTATNTGGSASATSAATAVIRATIDTGAVTIDSTDLTIDRG